MEMMKAHLTRLGAAVLLAAAALFSSAASAEQLVLVVDSDKLWEETAAGKDVQAQKGVQPAVEVHDGSPGQ